MALTPDQRRQLFLALWRAYEPAAFAQLVEDCFGCSLGALAPDAPAPDAGSFPAAVIQVIDRCEAQDSLADLLAHALANPKVKAAPGMADRALWDLGPRPQPAGTAPCECPTPSTHFTGRVEALGKLIADLLPGAVVTLSGPGGVGKTALAAQAVHALAPANHPPATFPGGVIFYTFYGRPDVLGAMEHIADACGVEKGGPPQERAARALAGRTALLVLDGAEQADDLPALLDLRGGCGALVTTRTHGSGDTPLTPLPGDEAASLLRAWAGRQAGAGAEADRAVARICDLAGSLPLAVRLAGAYMAECSVSAAEYLDWLEHATWEALHRGAHQRDSVTLLLDRSAAALGEGARAALGVVGLLALQPFEAEWVAAALGTEAAAAPRLLGELVKLSLLQRAEDGAYTVAHALIHTYARGRCSPDEGSVRLAAHYFSSQLHKLWQSEERDFHRLARLRPHVLALLEASVTYGAWQEVLDLCWAVEDYLDVQGFTADRLRVIGHAIPAAQTLDNRYDEGVWLNNLALAYSDVGRREEAVELHVQAQTIFREIGYRRPEGTVLGNIGNVRAAQGRTLEAITFYEQALAIRRETDDVWGEGNDLTGLGNAYLRLGQAQKAISYYERALAIDRAVGNRRGEGADLGNLGHAYFQLSKTDKAVEFFERALAVARILGDRRGESDDLTGLGKAYARLGRPELAVELFKQAVELDQVLGDRRDEADDLVDLGLTYATLGWLDEAISVYEAALAIRREIGDRLGEHIDSVNFAELLIDQGRLDEAHICIEKVARIAPDDAYTHTRRAQLAFAEGLDATALEHYAQATKLYSGHPTDLHFDRAMPLLRLGRADEALGLIRERLAAFEHPDDLETVLRRYRRWAEQAPGVAGLDAAIGLLEERAARAAAARGDEVGGSAGA